MKTFLLSLVLGSLLVPSLALADGGQYPSGALQFYGAHITDKNVQVSVFQYDSDKPTNLGNFTLSTEQWAVVGKTFAKAGFVVLESYPNPGVVSTSTLTSSPSTLVFYGAHVTALTQNDNTVQMTAYDTAFPDAPVKGNVTFSLDQWKAINDALVAAGLKVLNGEPKPISIGST